MESNYGFCEAGSLANEIYSLLASNLLGEDQYEKIVTRYGDMRINFNNYHGILLRMAEANGVSAKVSSRLNRENGTDIIGIPQQSLFRLRTRILWILSAERNGEEPSDWISTPGFHLQEISLTSCLLLRIL